MSECSIIINIFLLQTFTNDLIDVPLFLLVAKVILVKSEESLTAVCQVTALMQIILQNLINYPNQSLVFH